MPTDKVGNLRMMLPPIKPVAGRQLVYRAQDEWGEQHPSGTRRPELRLHSDSVSFSPSAVQETGPFHIGADLCQIIELLVGAAGLEPIDDVTLRRQRLELQEADLFRDVLGSRRHHLGMIESVNTGRPSEWREVTWPCGPMRVVIEDNHQPDAAKMLVELGEPFARAHRVRRRRNAERMQLVDTLFTLYEERDPIGRNVTGEPLVLVRVMGDALNAPCVSTVDDTAHNWNCLRGFLPGGGSISSSRWVNISG